MHNLTRRPSLCLFCTFAASTRPRRLLPLVQKASRTGAASRRQIDNLHFSRDLRGRVSTFNPLKSTRFSQPQTSDIETAVGISLEKLQREFNEPAFLESLSLTQETLDTEWSTFKQYIRVWLTRAAPEARSLFNNGVRGTRTLETRLRHLFFAQTFGSRFTKAEVDNQKELADLCYPAEWYPLTRAMPRTVHLHVGPTNSGKTYHALKRLEEAESGIYLGPLRLLAHEVYTRLNAKGRPCALVTGEEQRIPEGETKMWSCTVEMAPLQSSMDVAVIDEIQMINHKDRGWAWTQAFLGIRASELHLCGEARTVPLMRELCALVGDKIEVHEYERLTPLKVADRSLNSRLAGKLRKGDCIVSFSVLGIHALRKSIENTTGRKCAIVYGSLPPETRAQQARLFNDPDNEYDFLVASDAIGMGLNLSIKRVIFESTMKNNGSRYVPLEVSEIKQIAGRAGRYKTAHQAITKDLAQEESAETMVDATIGLDDAQPGAKVHPAEPESTTIGYATTLEPFDFPYLKRCMERDPEPIKTAGLFPPSLIVERFANYFPPGTPFSYIMLRLHEICEINPRFHLCSLRDQISIADVIHPVKNLSVQERIIICAAPTGVREEGERALLRRLAQCVANNESGALLDLPIPLEILDEKPSAERKYLYNLEQLHKMLVLYLWLSFRFPNVFTTRSLANHTKKLVEDAIEKTLSQFSYTERKRQELLERRREAMKAWERVEQPSVQEVSRVDSSVAEAVGEVMPQEMQDVLLDERSFADNTTMDETSDYPKPEFEAEDAEPGEAQHATKERRGFGFEAEQSRPHTAT